VTLGLDPSDFTKSQKQAADAFMKTRDQAASAAKSIEASGKKAADGINVVTREVLALFAVFLGARGLKEFITDLTSADAALGRFSSNLGQSPQTVAAWGMAAERMGGTAEATAGSFERIGKALYDLHRNGVMLPKEFSQLQAATGNFIDTDHGVDKFLMDTAAGLKELAAVDPARAHFIAQGMGIDDSTANVMIRYGAAIGDYIDQLKKLSPSNDAKASQQLQEKWNTLQQTAVSLANSVMSVLGPQLEKLLSQMTDWVTKNQDWIRSGIVEAVGKFAEWLKGIDWNAVGNGLKNFGTEAKAVTDAIGGVITASEILFGLWAGSKAIAMLANMRTALGIGGVVKTAGTAGTAAAGAGAAGVAAVAGAAVLGGVAAATLGGHGELGTLSEDKVRARMKAQADAINSTRDPGAHGEALSGPIDMRPRNADSSLMTAAQSASAAVDAGRARDAATPATPATPSYPQPDYNALTRNRDSHGEALAGATLVDGRPVSKSNPLPITNTDETGGGFLSLMAEAATEHLKTMARERTAGGGNKGPLAAVGASAGVRGWWTKERQQHAYERLTKEGGFSDQGAKGFISRSMNVEASGGPGEVNSIGATGIAQWLGSRKKRLLQMAQEQGKSWNDFDLQLSHVIEESKGSEIKAGQRFRTAKTAEEAAVAASMYERAEGYNSLTGRDNFTGRTLGGMRGIEKYVGATLAGAATSAKLTAVNNNSNTSSSTSSHEMHVGNIHVNAPQATDSNGIAGAITDSLFRSSVAATANYGPR